VKKVAIAAACCIVTFPLLLFIGGSSSAQGQWCNVSTTGQQSPGSGDTTSAAGIELDQEQTSNARTIVQVATVQDKLPVRAAAIALMTAMQESSLRDLQPTPGHDAAGLFQQRPVEGWGTLSEVLDPLYSTNAFLTGVPSAHIQGLTSIVGWQQMDMAQAAEMVQASGVGYEYAKWETFGTELATALSANGAPGVVCTDNAPSGYGGPAVTTVINRAMAELGQPYVWGGGGAAGPSTGFCSGDDGYLNGVCFASTHSGFDCSGLTQYAWWPYVQLPRLAADQYGAGTHVPVAQAQPGDLLFYSNSAEGIYHVVMVVQAGPILTVIEAPHTGENVDIQSVNPKTEPDLMPMAVRLTPPATGSSATPSAG